MLRLNLQQTTLSLIFTFLMFVNGFGQTAETWFNLKSDKGRFSLLMPGEPELTTETKSAYTSNLYLLEATGTFYVIAWVDYKPEFKFTNEAELKANRDNFLKEIDATLLSETKISLDGNPGIEFTGERTQDKAFIKSRVYIVGKRPYHLAAVTKNGSPKDIDKFLNSFKLIKGK